MLQITKRQVVRILILWLQAFISTFKGTSGSGKVTVQLVEYKNSESRVYNGDCCDNLSWCINECDNYFRLCFAKTTSANKCAMWNGWTSVLGDDSFSFPKSLGNGIMNPLTLSFRLWQPILFSVEVWDDDTGSANDLVDRYSLAIRTTPSSSSSTAAKRHKMSGKGSSYLNVNVKVFCDANYFIPDCSTYCTPRDDNSGHYTCDFTRGQKVCLSGWYGNDCLTHCVPRNDSLGHYSCDANGQIKCLSGWHGGDCLTYCVSRNDSLGHYSCDINGQRQCLSGWHGSDCLTYCVSRNDSLGHYSCDANGKINCLDNWHGRDCLRYCKARNDSMGHYSCDINGKRKCLSGWYGSDCLTYCVSRNSSLGHYSCDASGQRKCLSGWHGSNCITYCVSRNDSLGHYNCDANGHAKCLDNWYGKDCLQYCKARNNSSGHYICDANGQRQCLSGWHGSNCLAYCVSRNDSFGHYSCNANGVIKCLDNWYGRDCLIYCKSRNDSLGHYTCNSTGYVVCMPGLRGEKCAEREMPSATFITSVIDITKGLRPHMSSPQVSSLQSSASSQQTYALTFMPTPSIGSFRTKGEERTAKQTKTTTATIPSKLHNTLRQSIFQSARDSSLKTSSSALMPKSSVGLLYTKNEESTPQPAEMTRVTIPSTLISISGQGVLQTRAFNFKARAPNSIVTPSKESLYSKESEITETTRISVSLSTPLIQLVSTPSVEPPCPGNNEIAAVPTFQPEEISVNSGVLVEFQENEEQELVVLRVISTIKIFIAERLNKICRRNAETCSLSEEDTHSARFCPGDVHVRIHDVTENGVTLKIACTLPTPLNGMVPSQTLMEILSKSREDLENATQADITWTHADGLTTPRTSIYGKPNQLSRVSKGQSTSPLPFILGIAGAVLILAVVLFVVRAKVAKRNMIHPDRDDDLTSSPPSEYRAESDTIVLLSRAKEKYVYKIKEKTGLNMDGDLKGPDDIEEIYLT